MQRSFISLVQDAIESKYTYVVRNWLTGQLPADIRIIKEHLFNTYGKINETESHDNHDTTAKLTYDVSEPINTIFNAVEDLCRVVELSGSPYASRQQVNIGYLIFNKEPIFRGDVHKWMRKPATEKHGSIS